MNAQAVVERIDDATAVTIPAMTANPVMDMIRQAVADGQPLDVIRELKDMAKELAADEADRAFKAAFAAFKGEVVTVVRNRKVNDGPLKGRSYAELFSFVDAATPALSKHGLSHSWSITKDEKDWIEVTCTIEHSLGGKKQVKQGGPPDAGGAKNALQARISTVTYLERATFKAACGLAEQGDDDDGASGAKAGVLAGTINAKQIEDLRDLIERSSTDIERFCATYQIEALTDFPASGLEAAKNLLLMKIVRQKDAEK